MIFIVVPVILFLILYGIKVKKPGQYFDDNMSIEQTSCINGFFVAMVLFSHFRQYISLNTYDNWYLQIPIITTQLIVVSFLFYSGYGLMESKKKKGYPYIKRLPTQRFLKLWFEFAIAVCLYILVNVILNRVYDLKSILLAFTGWTSIGNSNWYINAMLSFYIIIYISFIFCKKLPDIVPVIITTVLSIGYIIGISYVRPTYCYDTFICLPIGMLFSLYKEPILNFLKKRKLYYVLAFVITLVSFILMYHYLRWNPYLFNIMSILFAFLLVLITMKVSIRNKFLAWLGKYTFWIYVLQRIPMIIFKRLGFAKWTYLYLWLTIISTIIIAVGVRFVVDKLESLIWRKKKNNANPVQTVPENTK